MVHGLYESTFMIKIWFSAVTAQLTAHFGNISVDEMTALRK